MEEEKKRAANIEEIERLKLQLLAEREEKLRIQLAHLDNLRQQAFNLLSQVNGERVVFAEGLKKKYGLGAGDNVQNDGTIAWAPVHAIDEKKAG